MGVGQAYKKYIAGGWWSGITNIFLIWLSDGVFFIAVRDCLTHYFFLGVIGQGSGSDWTLVVSPSLRTQDLVPHPSRKTHKNLIEIGPYGSPWVHIERIRSHGCRTGF